MRPWLDLPDEEVMRYANFDPGQKRDAHGQWSATAESIADKVWDHEAGKLKRIGWPELTQAIHDICTLSAAHANDLYRRLTGVKSAQPRAKAILVLKNFLTNLMMSREQVDGIALSDESRAASYANFDPSEARDEGGRWSGGESSSTAVASKPDRETHEAKLMAMVERALTDDHPKQYRSAAKTVVSAMPAKAQKTAYQNVLSVKFFGDAKSLTSAIEEDAGGYDAGGAFKFNPVTHVGTLYLDGQTGIYADGDEDVRQVYAHEFAHAVDWIRDPSGKTIKGEPISDTDEWLGAFRSEIDTDDRALSSYAQTSPAEGFAEFGRLAWLSPEKARESFPKCWAVWETHGLV